MVAILLFNSGYESRRFSREVIEIVSIVCIAAFGLSGILSFLKLLFPSELVLTPEGFSVRGLRKSVLIPWRDVQAFGLVEMPGGATMAGFVLKPSAKSGSRDRSVTKFMVPGFDGTIAVFPEEKPAWIVKVLNEWLQRYAPDQ
ncbi:hypothetical protein [Brevundimonas sp.]|uniref:hypothetical protein n=1 Tax=Brevundimonas sp. TaxID=1871086 RepID=UPI0026066825|nr:hypothetical protein [Brevundimonas sp.]